MWVFSQRRFSGFTRASKGFGRVSLVVVWVLDVGGAGF